MPNGIGYPETPQSRGEEYLQYICERLGSGGGGLTPEQLAQLNAATAGIQELNTEIEYLRSLHDQEGYKIQRDDGGFFLNIEDPNAPQVQFLALNNDPGGSSLMVDTGTAVYGTNDIAGNPTDNIFEIRR